MCFCFFGHGDSVLVLVCTVVLCIYGITVPTVMESSVLLLFTYILMRIHLELSKGSIVKTQFAFILESCEL